MSIFERVILEAPLQCDICGEDMIILHGGGWDNDRIYCTDTDGCGAEVVFPTSTEAED